MTPDLGHILLTALIGIIVYFLQRELARNDKLREETLKLVENCNVRLEGQERRITVHGTEQQLLKQRVDWLEREMASVRTEHDRLQERKQA